MPLLPQNIMAIELHLQLHVPQLFQVSANIEAEQHRVYLSALQCGRASRAASAILYRTSSVTIIQPWRTSSLNTNPSLSFLRSIF